MKINIIDTPGHADFGGEVERVLRMADGALVLVDAAEGPMPQTRFVLSKAFECGLRPIVVINKIDRPDARPHEVVDEVLELFLQLGADDVLADFPYLFTSAKLGYATTDPDRPADSIQPLMDMILEKIPGPDVELAEPLQMLVTTLDWSDYVGRIAIGRVQSGTVRKGQNVVLMQSEGRVTPAKVVSVYVFEDLGRVEVHEVDAGDICAIVGLEGVEIGDTVAAPQAPAAAAAAEGRRADAENDLRREHFAAGRPRGKVRHQPPPPRAAAARAGAERRPAGRADRGHGAVRRGRPRRAAPLRADRDHAPRRLRALGRQAAGDLPRDRRQAARAVRVVGGRSARPSGPAR